MGNKLKELRTKRGISQAAVAEFIGISRQMYNKYENGEVEPTVKAVKLLCKLYNISYDQLLNDSVTSLGNKVSYSKNSDSYNCMEVASPSVSYGVGQGAGSGSLESEKYGIKNYLSEIMTLIPKLLYSEKAKLLSALAQSMSADVEAGKLAQKYQNNSVQNTTFVCEKILDYKAFADGFNKIKELTEENEFNSQGKKWTREEMHER